MVPDISSFAYGLFSLLANNATETNTLVSPFSVASALGLVLAGTTTNSTGHEELSSILNATSHFDLPVLSNTVLESASYEPSVNFTSANGIWSRDLKPSYISTIKSNHSAEAADLPDTYEPIDEYIDEKTNGMITDMMEGRPIPPHVVAVLVNAIHFKGDWAVKFNSSLTTNDTFTTASGEERNAMFMNAEREMALATNVNELQGADIVRLDYGERNDYAAFFILPAESGNASMNKVIESLAGLSREDTEASLGDVLDQMSSYMKVALSLPRFKIEYGVRSIKEELRALGINAIFDRGGELMEMSDDSSLFVGDVFHKAVMEVTEEGTEAAAATVVIVKRSTPMPPIPIVFDRPFVMLILHTPTKTPLFLSRIDDPVFSF